MQRKPPVTVIKNIKPIGILDDLRKKREIEQGVIEKQEPIPPITTPLPVYHPHVPKKKFVGHPMVAADGSSPCRFCNERDTCGMQPRQSCAMVSKERDCI